jgi:hypothetical protein
MSFLPLFLQNPALPELYDWVILTSWAAVLLLLAVFAFFLLVILRTGRIWWQYLALLLLAGLGFWSLVVAYNGYQQWLHFNALLPAHGVYLAIKLIRNSYLTAIQVCQYQFALTASILVLLLGVAGWQLLHTCTKQAVQIHMENNRHRYLWMSGLLLLMSLCCFACGVFLITKLSYPLIHVPQDFQFEEPTTLESIGLYAVSLGGPLILLLLGITGIVRQSITPR